LIDKIYQLFKEFFIQLKNGNETPRGKQRGIKIPTAQNKSRSKLRGTNPKRD